MGIFEERTSRRRHALNTTQRRWMLFVDGENFTIRVEAIAKKDGIALKPGDRYVPGVFVWHPSRDAIDTSAFVSMPAHLLDDPIRAHYYTSSRGAENVLTDHRNRLFKMGFKPIVMKKWKSRASKGVDICLATDML